MSEDLNLKHPQPLLDFPKLITDMQNNFSMQMVDTHDHELMVKIKEIMQTYINALANKPSYSHEHWCVARRKIDELCAAGIVLYEHNFHIHWRNVFKQPIFSPYQHAMD